MKAYTRNLRALEHENQFDFVCRDRLNEARSSDFVHVGAVLPEVLKEVARRFELRQRLEAEGSLISDEEFIQIAERTGGVQL